eukprot:gene20902-25634_t
MKDLGFAEAAEEFLSGHRNTMKGMSSTTVVPNAIRIGS